MRTEYIFSKENFCGIGVYAAYIEGCNVTLGAELNLVYICKINEFVSRNESLQWGALRTGTVGVGDFTPTIPIKEKVLQELERIKQIIDPVEKALEYFAYACKQQLFWDGNKRTSTIVASKILIESGNGILTIGKNNAEEFNITFNNWYLNNWYLKDELEPLKDCLKKCIKHWK